MIIIKNKTKDCFARIPNLLLHDSNLKWKDKGLLAYLLSKPEGWKFQINDVIKRSTDGKDSVYSSLKNLIKFGYCLRTDIRDEGGKICGVEYSVADSPIFNYEEYFMEINEKPYAEKPYTEKPTISKKESNKTDLLGLSINHNKVKAGAFPWANVMAIFKQYRPDKKFRQNAKGITERNMKSFWRRNKKDIYCFELLCKKLLESDFLMGAGELSGHFPQQDPSWSWVFGKTTGGEWRADKIIEGDYSNEAMSFLKNSSMLKEVILIGKGKQVVDLNEKLDTGKNRFEQMGKDDYTGLDKYYDNK